MLGYRMLVLAKKCLSLKSANVFVFRKKQRHPVAKHPISKLHNKKQYTWYILKTVISLLLFAIIMKSCKEIVTLLCHYSIDGDIENVETEVRIYL